MASLSGNTINTSYQGLIKSESNGDFTTGFQYLTDGIGTRLPLWLDPSARQAGVENNLIIDNYSVQTDEPDFSIINHRFDSTQSPLSPFSGDSINMNMYDKNNVYVGGYDFQRFGNLFHRSWNGEHIFTNSGTNPASPDPKILIGAFNSPNNSDAWYEGYNKSIYSLTVSGNTLTFNTQDNTDYSVTLPSGGGASIDTTSTTKTFRGSYDYYKLNVPTTSYSSAGYNIGYQTIAFNPLHTAAEGQVINTISILVTNPTADSDITIGLYDVTDGSNGLRPTNLLTTFGTIDTTTSGNKTITGLNYTLPSTTDNIYMIGFLQGGVGTGTAQISGPANTVGLTYWGALDSSFQQRAMSWRKSGQTSLPSEIDDAYWDTTASSTTYAFLGFKNI